MPRCACRLAGVVVFRQLGPCLAGSVLCYALFYPSLAAVVVVVVQCDGVLVAAVQSFRVILLLISWAPLFVWCGGEVRSLGTRIEFPN